MRLRFDGSSDRRLRSRGKTPRRVLSSSSRRRGRRIACWTFAPTRVIRPLLGKGYKVIVRPHPEYTKRYRARWESLQQRFSSYSSDELYFEQDFSTSDSIYDSDVLITDWSSIACEFSFATLKPSVFVDTPMKVWNPDWRDLGIEPTDISLRNRIGSSIALDRLDGIADVVADMLENPDRWRDRIIDARGEMIYNLGGGGAVAGAYLLDRMLDIQEGKRGEGR